MIELLQSATAGFFATSSLILASLAWRTMDRAHDTGQDWTFRRLLPILVGSLLLIACSDLLQILGLSEQQRLVSSGIAALLAILALTRLFLSRKTRYAVLSLARDDDRFYREGLPFGEHLISLLLPTLLCLFTAASLDQPDAIIVFAGISAVTGILFSPVFGIVTGLLTCASVAGSKLVGWPPDLAGGLILLAAAITLHFILKRTATPS